jgi:hypothetical protein
VYLRGEREGGKRRKGGGGGEGGRLTLTKKKRAKENRWLVYLLFPCFPRNLNSERNFIFDTWL